jgi:hypothetical protein
MRSVYFTGQLTKDVAPKFIKEGDYSGARNLYFHTSKDGKSGLVRRYPGFKKITEESYGIVVGSVSDQVTSKVYYFVSGNDSIWVFDLKTETTSILMEYDFKFGPYVDAAILDDMLFFTDNVNQPRMINVNKEYTTVSDEDITIIKPSPLFPLSTTVVKESVNYSPLSRNAYVFSYRYVYENNQVSVLAPYTENIYCGETTVSINLSLSTKERIPTYVDRIEILSREEGTDFWRIISVVDTDFEQVIFSGIKGRQIDLTESQKPFENVPLRSKCVEVAKNRVFLANNTEGYNGYETPTFRAYKESFDTTPEPEHLQVWRARREQSFSEGNTITQDNYYVRSGNVFYFLASGEYTLYVDGVLADNTPGDYTGDEESLTKDETDYTAWEDLTQYSVDSEFVYDVSVLDPMPHFVYLTLNAVFSVGETKFKNFSQYQIGIVFYDRYSRSGGVYTNDKSLVTIEDDFRNSEIEYLKWGIGSIDNSEIPIWAESYQIVRTDNLTRAYFIQGMTSDVYWVYRVNNEDLFSKTYRADAIAIEIDIAGSFRAGSFYNFTEGDLIDIGHQTFRIESVTGSKIRVQSRSVSSFERTSSPWPVREYYEIWTPKQESVSEIVNGEEYTSDIFYEVSEVYKVLQPFTVTRNFEKTSGFLKGDVTVIEGTTFNYPNERTITDGVFSTDELSADPDDIVIESQNPDNINDIGWIKSLGRPNVVLSIGQVEKKNFIRFSNNIIQGTRLNGTSRFDFGDEDNIPLEDGEINVLSLTSKQQTDGNIMLAICDHESSSIYLNEVQVVDNEGQEVLSRSANVIGTIRSHKGSYGTRHPNSFTRHKGNAWWWDDLSKEVVRYSSNGIVPISKNGNRSYFFNGSGDPVSCYDPFHDLFFIGLGVDSFGFHETMNQWRSFYDFKPESSSIIEESMVLFKDGIPYLSNQNTYEYFDGEYQGEIEFYLSYPSPTILENIGIYSTSFLHEWSGGKQLMKPDIEIVVENEDGQETDLINTDFDVFESVSFAHFLRDKNSPGGLLNGHEMNSDIHKFTIKIRNLAEIEYININEQLSLGIS